MAKKKTYTVNIEAVTTSQVRLEVVATNAEEAQEKAEEIINNPNKDAIWVEASDEVSLEDQETEYEIDEDSISS